ncbi:GNAT family N-acetyltransferase [Plasticicumulans acidivorans]|uniref:Acetyltransferase (GNAT) family protein n=1 Tax=Plasticicumulans acidivorans TaxID=886464 RepID=A0A317MXE4_9GAMM|nr:GNAT family N-acetyltransferase [Plasticicumulans acidivorans]PWV63184.1 acetyltransferase (GNAT) family protein [Plasticicumulans acidivorans]
MQQEAAPLQIKSLQINELHPDIVPRALWLLADPSPEKIAAYLPLSTCFAAFIDATVVGACAVQARSACIYELMNIAVMPGHQKLGVGTQLLQHVITALRSHGAEHIEVGTGSFGYQLSFYQRQGFRVTSIDKDFFVRNYADPIIEDGIQLLDRLRLTISFTPEQHALT